MNKNVLRASIILIIFLLAFQYILKIFFPQEFVLVISNPQIIKFGNFVDKYVIVREFAYFITSLLTYYLYLCAACNKWRLNKKQTIIIILAVAVIQIITYFEPALIAHLSTVGMLGLAYFFKADFKTSIIIFGAHGLAQILSTKIRGLIFLLPNANYATLFCLMIEGFGWLLLFYITNNYKKEKTNG